jgi:hypothetical protein
MGTKTTKTTRFSNHNKNKVGLVLIQIMKQNKQKQEHDTCKSTIQQDFIVKKKQK